jgi:hypothetical protein
MAVIPPSVLSNLSGAGSSWSDRIREAAWTSPSGTRILFDYEEVSRETEKRGKAFEFPGVNDAYVQQGGFGPRRCPIRAIFSGNDCDRIATAFEKAVLESGVGKLDHPLYGSFKATTLGTVSRKDDLVGALNMSTVEVTFWSTTGVVYPSTTSDPGNEIDAALAGFDVAAAQRFSDAVSLPGAIQKSGLLASVRKLLGGVSAGLQSIADATSSVNREFRDIQSTVNFGLDVLVGQPLLLAQQIGNLITAPARALAGIEDRLDGYSDFAHSMFDSPQGHPEIGLEHGSDIASRVTRIANDFHTTDLFALYGVAGAVLSVNSATFTSKPQALSAAVAILTLLDEANDWRDAGFSALGGVAAIGGYQVDTGESIVALRDAVALAAGFLVQLSFTLVAEKRIVLDRDRTIVDLCAELYGSVDDRLDFLIATNDLTGSEILELPRGREILYYPASA